MNMIDLNKKNEDIENYSNLSKSIKLQIDSESDLIANLSNISSFIMHYLDNINWAGFYIIKGNILTLGPFQGKPACCRIPLGKGVCGIAAELGIILRIGNVHNFDGHIACDINSNSEIAIPLYKDGLIWGILDIDSPNLERFSEIDEIEIKKIASIIEEAL
jgi:GAF domain-containing protein